MIRGLGGTSSTAAKPRKCADSRLIVERRSRRAGLDLIVADQHERTARRAQHVGAKALEDRAHTFRVGLGFGLGLRRLDDLDGALTLL